MNRSEAIRLVRNAVKRRRLVFTEHALDEMDAEGETRESIAQVLYECSSCVLQDNGRWRVHGQGLTVIVQIEASTVIIWTVFAG